MQVREAMTTQAEYIPGESSLRDAAEQMRRLDCGFLPIGDTSRDRLEGVITDRDIVIRGLAEGKDPATATVEECKSDKVLYCFEDDDLADAARSMSDQNVYRLIVLNNPEDKQLSGIISLADIMRHGGEDVAAEAAESIVRAA